MGTMGDDHEPVFAGTVGHTPSDCLDLLERPGWHADALCREHPEVSWFDQGVEDVAAAKDVCGRCLAREDCLAYALANEPLIGVWGGLTASERRHLRRRSLVPA